MQIEVTGDVQFKIKSISETSVEFEACFIWEGKRLPLENNGIRCLPVDGSLVLHNIKTEIMVNDDWIREKLIDRLIGEEK